MCDPPDASWSLETALSLFLRKTTSGRRTQLGPRCVRGSSRVKGWGRVKGLSTRAVDACSTIQQTPQMSLQTTPTGKGLHRKPAYSLATTLAAKGRGEGNTPWRPRQRRLNISDPAALGRGPVLRVGAGSRFCYHIIAFPILV